MKPVRELTRIEKYLRLDREAMDQAAKKRHQEIEK